MSIFSHGRGYSLFRQWISHVRGIYGLDMLLQLLGKFIRDILMNVDAVRRNASLSGVEHKSKRHFGNNFVEICIREDDRRRFPAKFQRNLLQIRLGRELQLVLFYNE
jgi:hypothetical protein